MQKIIFKNSLWRYLILLFSCLMFVAISFFIRDKNSIVAWLGIIFFGSGISGCLWGIFNRSPRLIIDEQGVFDQTLRIGTILWEDIISAHLQSVNGNFFICLELRNSEKYKRKVFAWRKYLISYNKNFGFADFNLNLTGLAADPREVLKIIQNRISTFAGESR
jgi:hypothetical protein